MGGAGAEGRDLLDQGRLGGICRVATWCRRIALETNRTVSSGAAAKNEALLCRQAARKFTPETSPRLSVLLERLTDPESLLQVGDWIIECKTDVEELLTRVQDAIP